MQTMQQISLFDWIARPAAPILIAAPAIDADAWCGVTPRAWQASALPAALATIDAEQFGLVSAVMGSGKSIFLAELAKLRPPPTGRVIVVTTPTVKLVEQLAATLALRCGANKVGRYFTHAKEIRAIIVCCNPSAVALAAELMASDLIVSLWIADECHKSQSESMLAAAKALKPRSAIGCTATPFRALKSEDLSLWPKMLYEYSAKDAFADGVVVPPRLVQWTGAETPLDDVCLSLIRQVLPHGPGLCNATSIVDATKFADLLTQNRIAAGVIHSRLTRDAQAAVIESLKTGEIAVLVHVNMLSEGVDLPWLRWLCMRRAVGSCVRFCQEVGRVLRASPGKDCAYLLDPHDLFDSFGLTYEAMLAGAAQAIESKPEIDKLADDVAAKDDAELADDDSDAPLIRAKRLALFRRYVRRLYLSMLCAGIVEQKISSTSWRTHAPSDRQLAVLTPKIGGLSRDGKVPLAHRKALGVVAENADKLKKGDVSDMLSICFALQDRRRQGLPWPNLGDEPTEQP